MFINDAFTTENHMKNMMKDEENNNISTSGYIMNTSQPYFGQD